MKRSSFIPENESTRARALRAAEELLAEGGAEAVQLRTIAARIGSGVATLYHHFADKDALLATLTMNGFRRLKAELEEALGDARIPRPVDAVSYGYLRFMRKNLRLYALMHSSEMLASHPEIRDAEDEAFDVFAAAVAHDGRIPPERVRQVARVCWVLGRGIADVLNAKPQRLDRGVDPMVEEVLSGFAFLLSDRFSSSSSPRGHDGGAL